MFGGSLFRTFEEDPFFSSHHDRMRGMDSMFDFGSPFLAVENGQGFEQRQQVARRNARGSELTQAHPAMDPFGLMNSMFNFNSLMGNMFQQMERVQNDPNSQCFVQSSVMSYSNDGSGKPRVYQATTSTRQAPGGIRETRKAVRDSEEGIEKMSVGRHLNDRAHVITRQRSMRTGDMDENQDFINLDEAEAEQFDQEWRQRTSQFAGKRDNALGYNQRSNQQRRAIDNRPYDIDAYDSGLTASRPSNRHREANDRGSQSRRVK